jgi:DNA-damage-inducible protein J
MSKTALITARVDPSLKQATETILQQLGLTPSQAITMFYRQINLRRGLPFEVNLPNAETRQAIADAVNRTNVKSFETVDDALMELGI